MRPKSQNSKKEGAGKSSESEKGSEDVCGSVVEHCLILEGSPIPVLLLQRMLGIRKVLKKVVLCDVGIELQQNSI